MDPEIYTFMRNRINISTQTDNIVPEQNQNRADISTQIGKRRGGERSKNQNGNTRPNDRMPKQRNEENLVWNIPLLNIRRCLKSKLVGC